MAVFPLGDDENPIEITSGSYHTEPKYESAVYYKYIAEEDGTLIVNMNPETGCWYSVYNATTYEYNSYNCDSESAEKIGYFDVSAGDEIEIGVNTEEIDGMKDDFVDWILRFRPASDTCENKTHIEATAPGCITDGNIEYWFCDICETYWSAEEGGEELKKEDILIPAKENHDSIIHVEAVAPGCHYKGNIEYWYCADCDTVWADTNLTQITNHNNVIVPEIGGEVVHFEAIAPSCHYNGQIEYWYCAECEQYWQDEALTQLTNSKRVILPATGGEVVHFEAIEPGCHYLGNMEYWYCAECEQFWQDEACTQLTNSKNIILPEVGGEVIHFEAIAPSCHYLGNMEYWWCAECEQYWQDEACTQLTNSKNIILPATGSEELQHVSAVESTCWTEGNMEYWYCAECEQYWQDEVLTQLTNSKRVILPAVGHANILHFEAVEPGCHYNGNMEYWYCPGCEGFWQDEALTQLTNSKNVILSAVGEDILTDGDAEKELVVHIEATEPGCHSLGNSEYWYCTECEQYWQDEALTQLTNSKRVILPAIGSENITYFEPIKAGCHNFGSVEYWYCADCETYYVDEACTIVTNAYNVILPAIGSDNVTHVEAAEPTYGRTGNIEYWYCEDCDTYYADEACTIVTNSKNVILPELGSVHAEVSNEDFYTNAVILSDEAEQYKQATEVLKDVLAEKDFFVIEINLYYKATDEQVHVPGEIMTVTIPVPENLELGAGQGYVVYRLNEDGSYTACVTKLVDNEIAFETNHFGTFVVVIEDVVPVIPEEPSEPETPVEPEEPVKPEEPNEPDVPVEPEEPEKPSEPETPVEPEEPVKPEEPSEPDVPVEPEEPEKPSEPETPVEPEEPSEPDVPVKPDKPSEPDVPEEPDRPSESDKPSRPEVVLPPVSNEEVTDEIGANSAPALVEKENVVEVESAVDKIIEKMETDEEKTVQVITQAVAPEMTEDLFAAAKDKEKDIVIGVVNENNQLMYSWTFAGNEIDMNKVTKPMDLTISFATDKQAEIEQVTGKDNGMYVAIDGYEGELPAPAKVKTYVGENYANGTIVYLYYYNEATQTVELTGNRALTVNGGYVEYVLEHCSIYFISENTPTEYGLDESGTDEPGTEEPSTGEPDEPGTEEPSTGEPDEPGTENPETSDYLADRGFFWAIIGFVGIALLALRKREDA